MHRILPAKQFGVGDFPHGETPWAETVNRQIGPVGGVAFQVVSLCGNIRLFQFGIQLPVDGILMFSLGIAVEQAIENDQRVAVARTDQLPPMTDIDSAQLRLVQLRVPSVREHPFREFILPAAVDAVRKRRPIRQYGTADKLSKPIYRDTADIRGGSAVA